MIDLFMAKTLANREQDREFNMALLRLAYVTRDAAITLVSRMPVDDTPRKAMRARIRRWVKLLAQRGYRLP